MADVTLDTKFEKGQASGSSPFSFVSNAGTVAGTVGSHSDRGLIGVAAFGSTAASLGTVTMTWAGNSMTQIGTTFDIDIGGGNHIQLCLFGLKTDALVTTGNQTLSVAWTGGHTGITVLGGVSLYNVDGTTGWSDFTTATNTGTAATLTVPNVGASDMAVASLADNNASSATITAPAVSDWDERAFNGNYNAGHRGGNGTVAWTLGSSVIWGEIGVRVIATASGTTIAPGLGSVPQSGKVPSLGFTINMPDQP